ncbi:hypothetical protein Tco_1515806 [Tanacetum coccineum]
MSGNEDHHRQGRRFAARGNRHDERIPRDVELKKTYVNGLALKVEKQLLAKQKTTTRFGSSSRAPQSATGPVRVGPIKAEPPALIGVSPTPTTSSLRCFKCQGIGHLKRGLVQ